MLLMSIISCIHNSRIVAANMHNCRGGGQLANEGIVIIFVYLLCFGQRRREIIIESRWLADGIVGCSSY